MRVVYSQGKTMKNKNRICAAVTALSLSTLTITMTAAPTEAKAVESTVEEAPAEEALALPALALVAVGGLVVAFGIGFAQGYMEAKNAKKGTAETQAQLSDALSLTEYDYVLN